MIENQDILGQLLVKVEALRKRQDEFSVELDEINREINRLQRIQLTGLPESQPESPPETSDKQIIFEIPTAKVIEPVRPPVQPPYYTAPQAQHPPQIKADFEKFIGENLINKIGIAITVIGVAIGAKYSIEHQLISPLTRIILGYLMGLGLLGVALKLKKDYGNFSAVLMSGAMAIMFFITYAAYSFYNLMPQVAAFLLMVVFTAFTVAAAINYNRQVIAHIGLVGAYAVPFLLSEGAGRVAILFSYIAIINSGILIIAFKKYWKPLYYSSFILTWIIFGLWYDSKYQATEHMALALIFLTVFFALFYLIFLAYKLIQKEKFNIEDIILVLSNSFIFYGVGYSILISGTRTDNLLGLFTLCNALIHFGVSVVIYRWKLADRNLFYLVAGLVLVFVTLAVPVQLDGNWVTLLWAGEAALLFWIGRTQAVSFYEKLSFPLMLLALFSIMHDWMTLYPVYNTELTDPRILPLLNINFLSSVLFVAAFIFINIINRLPRYDAARFEQPSINSMVSFAIPAILITGLYFAFRMEIACYWKQLYADSALTVSALGKSLPETHWNEDLMHFKLIWEIIYSLLFFSVLSVVNIGKLRDRNLGMVNLGLNTLVMLVFLFLGFYALGELKESYLGHTPTDLYQRSILNIGIRYILFAFAGGMLVSTYSYLRQEFMKPLYDELTIAFDSLLYITLLWIASSELIVWMDIMKSEQSTKLGLSILWGVYALLIIVLGIWKKKKHLRMGAIVLFGITLVKLFFYDISYLDTISKTIVFVSLGLILLIVSFLYNKYKHLISGEIKT